MTTEHPWLPGGVSPAQLVEWELFTAREEGKDPEHLAELESQAEQADDDGLITIYKALLRVPVSDAFPYNEPDDLEAIRELRPQAERGPFPLPYPEETLYDRLYGAWLGRCAGCTLGGPGETFRPHARAKQKAYLSAFKPSEWPIRDYLPLNSPAELTFRGFKTDATRGNIAYAPQDDDLTHTMLCQIALHEIAPHPLAFETQDIARAWLCHLPVRLTEGGTAMMAYRNLLLRYPMRMITANHRRADGWIDWHWVATHSNPYRQDLDASLRADSYGYACPGNPELAAELAWRDARASNVKNGIYCSMLYAAMLAAAFVTSDPWAVTEAGLAEIPATSKLYDDAQTTLDVCRQHRQADMETVHDALYAELGDKDKGTSNNMAMVLSSLVLGYPDFEKVITWAVMGGWDCDCTGATAGSIAGLMLGAGALPAKWIEPLNDTVHGGIAGYQPIAISECARRSLEIARLVLKSSSSPASS